MLGCCHFCKHHIVTPRAAWKNASSIPWASQHPSKSRASIQGGERPLSHSPCRESAEGWELRPDTSAPSAMLLPERMLFPRAEMGWERRAWPIPLHGRSWQCWHRTGHNFPLALRFRRIHWGGRAGWAGGGGRGEGTGGRLQSCMYHMKAAVCREEALQALTESSPGPRLPDGP